MPEYYRRIPARAIPYTGDGSAVERLLPVNRDITFYENEENGKRYVRIYPGNRTAFVGDWIVYEDGHVMTYKPDEFHALYAPCLD